MGDGEEGYEGQGDLDAAAREELMPVFQQVISGDAHHEEAAQDEGADQRVYKAIESGGIQHGFIEVGQLGAVKTAGFHDVVARRRLLPGIRDNDPDGREDRAQRHHDGREEVHARRDSIPAEYQYRQEAGFEEEGEDALGRQGGAEDVADEARIAGPVGSELEFHDDAGGHAHGENQGEDVRPEFGHGLVLEVLGAHVHAFHEDQQ